MTKPFRQKLRELIQEPLVERQVYRHKVNGHIVSTIFARDVGAYETAVQVNGQFYVVERYPTRDEASTGHTQWCQALPRMKTIRPLGHPDLGPHCCRTVSLVTGR